MKSRMAAVGRWLKDGLTVRKILVIILGAMICSFGIHNIHQRTDVTEGGILGLMLFFEHWLGFSPAYITPVLDLICYALALKFLGWGFIKISAISTMGSTYDEVEVGHEGDDLLIAFNNRFLIDSLRACDAERVRISMTSALTSINIEPEEEKEEESQLFMLLPVRMRE